MRTYSAKKGAEENPLKKISPNVSCLCGSMKKVKNCCGRFPFIKSDEAQYFRRCFLSFSSDLLKALGMREKDIKRYDEEDTELKEKANKLRFDFWISQWSKQKQ